MNSPQKLAASIRKRNNGRFGSGAAEPPPTSAALYGSYVVAFAWPPREGPITEVPPELKMGKPALLENTLFACCQCSKEILDKLQPVKVIYDEISLVQACEIVTSESEIPAALARTTCYCRTEPLSEKFAILPLNEQAFLYVQRFPDLMYPPDVPNTCLLIFKVLPSAQDIRQALEGLQVTQRYGAVTFLAK